MRSRPSDLGKHRIEVAANLAQRRLRSVNLQRVVLALHRDHHGLGSNQADDRQHVQRRRRTIKQYESLLIAGSVQCVIRSGTPVFQPDQLDLGTSQLAVAKLDIERIP